MQSADHGSELRPGIVEPRGSVRVLGASTPAPGQFEQLALLVAIIFVLIVTATLIWLLCSRSITNYCQWANIWRESTGSVLPAGDIRMDPEARIKSLTDGLRADAGATHAVRRYVETKTQSGLRRGDDE